MAKTLAPWLGSVHKLSAGPIEAERAYWHYSYCVDEFEGLRREVPGVRAVRVEGLPSGLWNQKRLRAILRSDWGGALRGLRCVGCCLVWE